MRIVVLDAHTLNPGDLSWDALRAFGECAIHERTAPALVVERAAGAELVLTNKTPLTRASLAALPALRYVGVLATGFNIVDTAAARERGIPVCNVPAYGTRSVAQHTFALLLELANRAGHHAASVREGRWAACPDYAFADFPLVELDGLTMGVVGFGRIGRAVAELARGFGMRVLAFTRTPPGEPATGVEFADLETLFRQSDVVSLHCPLTPETDKLVDATRLGWMKAGAFLLNTSRGPLVDEAALADALNTGRIAGAGLDVLSTEPPPAGNPLFTAKHCIITPHNAWMSRAARSRLMSTAMDNVRAFLAGTPRNVVN
ncbi:MAG: D-2-hydroxyacid dehydrogenase [Verrucomicrobia bacterium]|nr:D-2-hydroxyacid dehydrogenase [Verrucomicrobiota bacterium]